MRMGQRTDQKSIDVIKADLNLDLPLHKQQLPSLNDLSFISIHDVKNPENRFYLDPRKYGTPTQLFGVRGNDKSFILKAPYLRRSYINQRPVWDIIKTTLPETVVLAITAIIFASIIGIIFGILTALYKNTWFDRGVSVFSTLGMATSSSSRSSLHGCSDTSGEIIPD